MRLMMDGRTVRRVRKRVFGIVGRMPTRRFSFAGNSVKSHIKFSNLHRGL